MDKAQLRKDIRKQRRELSPGQHSRNSEAICQRLGKHPWLLSAKHIALYLANDGEPDVLNLILQTPGHNRHFYLPCLDSYGRPHMVFRHWSPGDPLQPNRFGILEPLKGPVFPVWALSLVLLPLVAFDAHGNRLGMGAGYYDRTLIHRRGGKHLLPHLVGIAHDFQEVDAIKAEPWDIPLDLVVTNRRMVEPA